jgi:hypothetical protein
MLNQWTTSFVRPPVTRSPPATDHSFRFRNVAAQDRHPLHAVKPLASGRLSRVTFVMIISTLLPNKDYNNLSGASERKKPKNKNLL